MSKGVLQSRVLLLILKGRGFGNPLQCFQRISPPNSPGSCGCKSCSGAGPSSGPRRRAPRPRWDKPS